MFARFQKFLFLLTYLLRDCRKKTREWKKGYFSDKRHLLRMCVALRTFQLRRILCDPPSSRANESTGQKIAPQYNEPRLLY